MQVSAAGGFPRKDLTLRQGRGVVVLTGLQSGLQTITASYIGDDKIAFLETTHTVRVW